jgi:vacuolar-type H+-ATPase subunit E/Vma4
MSVEAMVRLIAEEAATEAAAIVAAAQADAASLVAEAQRAVDARVAAARATAEPAIRGEGIRMVNAARLRLLEDRAERTAERSAGVFAEAGRRLTAIVDGGDPDRWRRALERLTLEGVELVGPGAEVRVRSADRDALTALAASRGARLTTLGPDAPPGPLVRSADGRLEVDATLPARVRRAELRLAETVAVLLAGESAPGEGGGP